MTIYVPPDNAIAHLQATFYVFLVKLQSEGNRTLTTGSASNVYGPAISAHKVQKWRTLSRKEVYIYIPDYAPRQTTILLVHAHL